MALDKFIPQVWSASLLQSLKKAQVFAQAGIVNRDYEGDIRGFGDRVRINSFGAISVNNYTGAVSVEDLNQNDEVVLTIDQSKYFAFKIDDVDKAQQNPKLMTAAMEEAAYALSDATDRHIASLYNDAKNHIADVEITKTNAYDILVQASVKLDEENAAKNGRFVIVPPWVHGELLKSDQFVRATAMGDDVVTNGMIGTAAGFTVLASNNVATSVFSGTTYYNIIAGTSQAISFAEQLKSVEAFRPEESFADAVKGLHLYGAKVVRPEALVHIEAKKA